MKSLDENDRLKAGTLPSDLVADSVPFAPTAPEPRNPQRREFPPFRSIDELAAAPDAAALWVWKGVLAITMVTMLIGKPKKGKSTLTYALLAALEEGRRFLGLDTLQTIAVLITEEATATVLQKCRRFGLKSTRCWTRADRVPGAAFADILDAAVSEALRIGAKIIVIDTLAGWAGMGPDAEKDAGHGQATFDLLQAAAQRGAAILVIHHARKANGEEADVARGSGALVAAADVQVQISVPSNGSARTLSFIGRADETPGDISFELVGSAFEVVSAEAAQVRVERDVRERLLARLREATGQDLTDLREAVGAKKVTVKKVLTGLVGEGLAHRTGGGKRADPHLFWRGPAPAPTGSPTRADSGPASSASDELPLSVPTDDLRLPVPVPPLRGGDPGPESNSLSREDSRPGSGTGMGPESGIVETGGRS